VAVKRQGTELQDIKAELEASKVKHKAKVGVLLAGASSSVPGT
jgi:hypothetical protein